MSERMMLLDAGIISKAEFREWYFNETKDQATAAVDAIAQETAQAQMAGINQLLPKVPSQPQGGPTE